MTAERLLANALAQVESDSIRAWATSDHNKPIWLEIARRTVRDKGDAADPVAFSAYIVCTAIGA